MDYLEAKIDQIADGVGRLERAILERDRNILVSCNEAARHLKVSPATISRWVSIGKVEKVTIDGSSGIRMSQIEELKSL